MDLNRRDFARLTALGLASQLVPTATQNMLGQASGRKIGYAPIGLGRISRLFMQGVAQSSASATTGLVSGHNDKAEGYATQYNVPKTSVYTYENFDSIKDNKSIDAVYIGLPNSMHAEYTIRAAKAGKHVLCEKPMAVNVRECEAMIEACRSNNVKLMVAYRLHFEPLTNLRAIQLLRDGAIGKVHSMQLCYGFDCDPKDWRVDRKMSGGGPMMDVGIYCLNASRYLTGEEPSKFEAIAYSDVTDPRFKDIEGTLVWVTRFPSGIVASCNTTYAGQMDGYFKVMGTRGWIEANPAYNYDKLHLRGEYWMPGGKEPVVLDEPNNDKNPIHFTREADYFSNCILKNEDPKNASGEEGLLDIKYITEIYRSAGIKMMDTKV